MPIANLIQRKHIQAAVVVAGALVLLTIAAVMSRHDAGELATNDLSLSGSENQSPDGGGNLFSLPQASPDFVGAWYGVLPATRREPPNWGTDKHAFGTGFFLVEGRVVMKLGLYAGENAKVSRLNATGVNSKHVRVENEIATKDTRGASLWIREQRDIMLRNKDTLDCTETVTYYRDPKFAKAVGTVQYSGALKRASEAEMKAHVQEMEGKGMKKQAETETAVPNR